MKVSEGSSTATPHPPSHASCGTRRLDRVALTGPSLRLDPRVNAYRKDVADIALAGRLFAPHYAQPLRCSVTVDHQLLYTAPEPGAHAASQLLRGEDFLIVDIVDGWAWGRCAHDDYVGYLPADALGPVEATSHRVAVPLALVFAEPDIKAAVVGRWPIGARFSGTATGDFIETAAGHVHTRHAVRGEQLIDAVGLAERLIGQPYLWGGRGGGGIDCSGLVQLAMSFAGIAAPRDSDMQRQGLGKALPDDAALQRGDLVFFPGHVGIMADTVRLIHANAFAMAVTVEPLAAVVARLAPDHDRPILGMRRPS